MTKLGQVEITTAEPFRWGTGESGDATWTGRVGKSGVYNFRNLTIAANAEILVGGANVASNPAQHSLVIFATESITFGNNSVINGQRYGSNSGRDDYDGWRQYTPNGGQSNNPNTNPVSVGGGGGGAGNNTWGNQSGFSSAPTSFKYTNNNGTTFVGNNIAGSAVGNTASGGSAGNDRSGNQGSNGNSVSTPVKNIIKNNFHYTMKGYHDDDPTPRDDFPFVTGGDGGTGGTSNIRRGNTTMRSEAGGGGGHGGACVILVSPSITFPDAERLNDAPDGGYPNTSGQSGRSGYTSNAAMIYVRGQTRSTSDNGAYHARPGDSSSTVKKEDGTMSEEGVGGCNSGGTGAHRGMNGKRLSDGGSAGGGGGGGGTCVIIYNQLRGHPTIRTYGGQGGIGFGEQNNNYGSSSGNKGGGGGTGGHGYMAIGWKNLISGPISWVKESNFGMKKGILIENLINPNNATAIKHGPSEGLGEDYTGLQWPRKNFNNEFLVDTPDAQTVEVVPQAIQMTQYMNTTALDGLNGNHFETNYANIVHAGQGYSVDQVITVSPPATFAATAYQNNYVIHCEIVQEFKITVTSVTGDGGVTGFDIQQRGQYKYWTNSNYTGAFSLAYYLLNCFGTLPAISYDTVPFTPAEITVNWGYYGGNIASSSAGNDFDTYTNNLVANNHFARNDSEGVINNTNYNTALIIAEVWTRWRIESISIDNGGGGYTGTPTLNLIGVKTTEDNGTAASVTFNKDGTTGALTGAIINESGNYHGRGSVAQPIPHYGSGAFTFIVGQKAPDTHTASVAYTASGTGPTPYYSAEVLNG